MNEQMRDALRQAEDKAAGIEALWQSVPPQTCVGGIRLPHEIRELAGISSLLVAMVREQQEELAAQQKELAKLKERLGS